MAQQYEVKQGDTLNAIAKQFGYTDHTQAGISGYSSGNPDLIKPGEILTINGGPKVTEVPGVGTLTVKPKGIQTTTPTVPQDQNMDGLYARTGVTPPAGTPAPQPQPNGYQAPGVAGLPSYPTGYDAKTSVDSILKSYEDTKTQITNLETKIADSSIASDEENRLKKLLNEKRAQLDTFDLNTLQATESLHGQGRGKTIANIALSEGKVSRVRALERLGLAQEADTLTNQLALTKEERLAQGDLAKTEYGLATKKLDIALGIQNTIKGLADDEKDNARQYLLDVVSFSKGKTYSELDSDTQQAITSAVANSPLTLGMVKAALEKGAEGEKGELRSVSGVGVVRVMPDGSYSVVVPENPGSNPTSDPNAPSFEEYITQQGYGLQSLVPDFVEKLRAEYNTKYGGENVTLGKLTATNKTDLSQAGLTSAPTPVQSYFLNTPAAFRDDFQRKTASGEQPSQTLEGMIDAYTKWLAEKNKSNSSRDWNAIINASPTQ